MVKNDRASTVDLGTCSTHSRKSGELTLHSMRTRRGKREGNMVLQLAARAQGPPVLKARDSNGWSPVPLFPTSRILGPQ